MKEKNGSNLEQAMAVLIQNQAMFVRDMAEIRKDLEQIKGYLIRHEQILQGLPEAIRQTIGFKSR